MALNIKDLARVQDRRSLYYGKVGMVTIVLLTSPVNMITVYFDHPIDRYVSFAEDELELFLEAHIQMFKAGERVEIVDPQRHAYGWFGTVTKVSNDFTVVYVLVDGEQIPRWYLNDQLQKSY